MSEAKLGVGASYERKIDKTLWGQDILPNSLEKINQAFYFMVDNMHGLA